MKHERGHRQRRSRGTVLGIQPSSRQSARDLPVSVRLSFRFPVRPVAWHLAAHLVSRAVERNADEPIGC